MLKHLTLKNFVLVDNLEIEFGVGLTTITGESGAGKSILLSALGLLLGERANTDQIRPGTDRADVSAEFDLASLPHLVNLLEQEDLDADPGEPLLVRRVVTAQGRSRAYVNGVPVTTQFLRGLSDHLVDIHGQHEHLKLSDRNHQLTLLDDYVAKPKLLSETRETWGRWQACVAEIERLKQAHTETTDRRDLLTYQLAELEELDLSPGDVESTEREHKRLAQAQDIAVIISQVAEAVDNLDNIRHAATQLGGIDDDHAHLTSAQANLNDALALIEDAGIDIRRYQDQVVIDPEALSDLESRLNTILDLARKHRVEAKALPEHTEALTAELSALDADDSKLLELEGQVDSLKQAYDTAAEKLSKARHKAAPKFSKAVASHMTKLGIKQGGFEVAFEAGEWEHGTERVDFMVTTNPNFPAGTLKQIASGGEQTRIALSIQIVAAQTSALPCLILDEADVGVGGTTADTVGRLLRELGNHTQVICITHAPQVAALGNNHFRVVKEGEHTNIYSLDQKRRVEELARMLAGSDITDQTRDYAAALLEDAS